MKFHTHKKQLHIITILYILIFLFINVQSYKFYIKHFSVMAILNLSMVECSGLHLSDKLPPVEFTLKIVSNLSMQSI